MILLNMSFSATAIVILISVMRKLFLNKIPKIFFYLFWIVPLFRLLFPVNIPGIWNLGGTLNSLVSQVFFDNITIAEKLNSTQDTSLLPGVDMNTYETSGIFIVWLIGCMLLALYFTINHFICRHEYKKASLCKDIDITKYYAELNVRRKVRILASNRVTSPLTYGLISPCIIFPHKMDFNDSMHLRNILIHELTHIKRFDVMFKFLLTACLCLHWFNPFIWLMFFIANRDIELSCDEFVLKNLSVDDKKLYALSLLDFCNKIIEPNICAGFAVKNNIEERIVAIVKSNSANKRDLKVKITSTLVCAFIFAFSGIALSAFGISSSIINEVEISSNLKVPNCINMTLEEARTYLLSNGFEVIIQSTN